MTRRRGLALALFALVALLAAAWIPRPLHYTPPTPMISDVDAWAAAKVAESQQRGVRPRNEERLLRVVAGESPVSILYLHGFGASRGEGELVTDQLAGKLRANTLYGLLPGHGLDDMDAHAAPDFDAYLDNVEESFVAARMLGERVVLVGTSTGGLLATWLAARHPDDVAALILASPFYRFADAGAALLADRPVGPLIIETAFGDVRDAGWKTDPERRKMPGYEGFWTTRQRYAALFNLARLRRYIATPETLSAVRAPTLLLYFYRDEEHQDTAASVDGMKAAFAAFGGAAGPHPQSRMVAISDGSHVLLSQYVAGDKVRILAEIEDFLRDVGLMP